MNADSGHRPLVNVFSCANKKYEDFTLLFALSNLYHLESSVVEVGLEDPDSFAAKNEQALALLDEEFGQGRLIIRSARFRINGRRVQPGTVRFIETPSPSEYVYISDIDIITLDPSLVNAHVSFMARRNLAYSNSVRLPDPSRMSGLHFARYDAWYPLPYLEDLIFRQLSDEKVLRIICERKGFPVQQEEWFRPVHGIHVSPNRSPLGSMKNGIAIPGWNIDPYVKAFQRFAASSIAQKVRPLFSERIRCYLEDIELVCSAPTVRTRHDVKQEFRLKYQQADLSKALESLLRSNRYAEASALESKYLARHPGDCPSIEK